MHSNFSSIFTRLRDIAAFVLQHATFSHPPLVSPKFPHVPLGAGGWPLGYEERKCWANCPRVRLVSEIANLCGTDPPTLRTDGQTDRQTTCGRNTALCTIVHRAVKTRNIIILDVA